MRLLKLRTVELHGSLNLELDFNEDLNLLVGINGSGKTSALNVVEWLLKPKLEKLATQKYSELSLSFLERGNYYVIRSVKDKSSVRIKIENNVESFNDIVIDFDKFGYHEEEEVYSHLTPEPHEIPAWNFLRNLTAPVIVSLERTISAEVEDEVYYSDDMRVRKVSRPRVSAIEHVQEVFSKKLAEIREVVRALDEDLKTKIILSSLDNPRTIKTDPSLFELSRETTEELEQKVIMFLSSTKDKEEVAQRVRSFFSYFRDLSTYIHEGGLDTELFRGVIQSQFSRIDQLARAFNEFEEKRTSVYEPITNYLEAVNTFLIDSGKRVYPEDSRGRLVFVLEKEMGRRTTNTIKNLSSGEIQIIILFALVAFETKQESVFIVDEPELSLHPKWQNDFMESFMRLCPTHSQMIIATHSPEIVGRRKDNCIFFQGQ